MGYIVKYKILSKNEWLELRETENGYVYSHEYASGGKGVAVLAYRDEYGKIEIVGRHECCPCHDDHVALTSLTGQVDGNEYPEDTAVRELKEEAGISVTRGELCFLGAVRPSKSADTTMWLFSVNVGHRDIGEIVGDGTPGERGAFCIWVPMKRAIFSKCPIFACLVARNFSSRFDT